MISGKEELAGGYRLANVRRTKRYLYLVEVAILVAAIILVVLVEGRASLVPFYLPINSFIYFVLLMGLIIAIESFVFGALEMRMIKSVSTKFYICKIGIRRAMVTIVVCVVVILLLWLPFIATAIEDTTATHGRLTDNGALSSSSYVGLSDRDPLGLSALKRIDVVANGGTARVYLVSEQNWNLHKDNMTILAAYRINLNQYIVTSQLSIGLDNLPQGKYVFVMDTEKSSAPSVDYTMKSALSQTFLGYVPFFAMMFAIAYAAWMIYLIPLKRKYSEAAIYR